MNEADYVALRVLSRADDWGAVPLGVGIPGLSRLEQEGWAVYDPKRHHCAVTIAGMEAMRRAQTERGDWRYPKLRALWEALIDLQGRLEAVDDALLRLGADVGLQFAGMNGGDDGLRYCPPADVVKFITGQSLSEGERAFRELVDDPKPVQGIVQRVYWADHADRFWRAWVAHESAVRAAKLAYDAGRDELIEGTRLGVLSDTERLVAAIKRARSSVGNLWRSKGWNPFDYGDDVRAKIEPAVRELDHLREALRESAEVWPDADAGNAKPPALPAGRDEFAGPALTANQSRVLQTMALFDASRLVSTDAIAGEMDAAGRLSARTIGPIVRRLIELCLAERPEGDRSGARLTAAGRRLAPKIAD